MGAGATPVSPCYISSVSKWSSFQGVLLSCLWFFAELAGAQFCFLSLGPLNDFIRHFEPLNFHKHITHFLGKIVALSLIT